MISVYHCIIVFITEQWIVSDKSNLLLQNIISSLPNWMYTYGGNTVL